MSSKIIGTLGVMACRKPGFPPFAEKQFLRELSLKSEGLGMQVFVFVRMMPHLLQARTAPRTG